MGWCSMSFYHEIEFREARETRKNDAVKQVAGVPLSRRLAKRIWWSWEMGWWFEQLKQDLKTARFYGR